MKAGVLGDVLNDQLVVLLSQAKLDSAEKPSQKVAAESERSDDEENESL